MHRRFARTKSEPFPAAARGTASRVFDLMGQEQWISKGVFVNQAHAPADHIRIGSLCFSHSRASAAGRSSSFVRRDHCFRTGEHPWRTGQAELVEQVMGVPLSMATAYSTMFCEPHVRSQTGIALVAHAVETAYANVVISPSCVES
jgi:hypothetical protein